ncbi:hypothetical protein LEMLEM_LOCUS10684 [Lemmus lemmus]
MKLPSSWVDALVHFSSQLAKGLGLIIERPPQVSEETLDLNGAGFEKAMETSGARINAVLHHEMSHLPRYEHVIIQLTQSVSASQHQAWPQRCDCLESARTRYGCSDSPPDLEWARM